MKKILSITIAFMLIALCAACSTSSIKSTADSSSPSSEEVTSPSSDHTSENTSMESANDSNANAESTEEESTDSTDANIAPDAVDHTENTDTSSSMEASTTPTTKENSTSSTTMAGTKNTASPDQQTQAFQTYTNGRFGFSINYPASWTAGEESDNGDGKVLYVGDPDVDIRVYGANYMEDVSDPYHHEDKNIQLQKVKLNNGLVGTLAIGKENNKIIYDMAYVSKDDVEYHFYANVSQKFFDQNQQLLLKVAKSLSIPSE